tara:strand:+ start:327 stop:878 length:552 start_codon:yes stop_codon:yes gene_type:complete
MENRVLDFWFNKSTPEQWFIKDPNFDESIRLQFSDTLDRAINGEFDKMMDSARSCLALIIVLDQFPRNLFRNNKRAFEQDPKALSICKHAIKSNHINQLVDEERLFALLPLIHSENIKDHNTAEEVLEKYLVTLSSFERTKKAWNDHTAVINRFGQYPHRNFVLGRPSSQEEITFLKGPNSSW